MFRRVVVEHRTDRLAVDVDAFRRRPVPEHRGDLDRWHTFIVGSAMYKPRVDGKLGRKL
ncbi:hypothetical protein JCM18237_26100 [Halorubrum luteum]